MTEASIVCDESAHSGQLELKNQPCLTREALKQNLCFTGTIDAGQLAGAEKLVMIQMRPASLR